MKKLLFRSPRWWRDKMRRSDRKSNRKETLAASRDRERLVGLVKHLERQLKAQLALDALDCLIFRLWAALCVAAMGQKYTWNRAMETHDFIVRARLRRKRTVKIYWFPAALQPGTRVCVCVLCVHEVEEARIYRLTARRTFSKRNSAQRKASSLRK